MNKQLKVETQPYIMKITVTEYGVDITSGAVSTTVMDNAAESLSEDENSSRISNFKLT